MTLLNFPMHIKREKHLVTNGHLVLENKSRDLLGAS